MVPSTLQLVLQFHRVVGGHEFAVVEAREVDEAYERVVRVEELVAVFARNEGVEVGLSYSPTLGQIFG